MRLTERTYLNEAQDTVVPENSPKAAFLLGHEGAYIEDDTALRLGILVPGVTPAEASAPAAPAEDKQRVWPKGRGRGRA